MDLRKRRLGWWRGKIEKWVQSFAEPPSADALIDRQLKQSVDNEETGVPVNSGLQPSVSEYGNRRLKSSAQTSPFQTVVDMLALHKHLAKALEKRVNKGL